MDGGQSSRVRADLLGLGASFEVDSQDGALTNEEYMATSQLLLELTNNALLDVVAVKGLEELDGDEDDDGLLSTRDLDLLGREEEDTLDGSLVGLVSGGILLDGSWKYKRVDETVVRFCVGYVTIL